MGGWMGCTYLVALYKQTFPILNLNGVLHTDTLNSPKNINGADSADPKLDMDDNYYAAIMMQIIDCILCYTCTYENVPIINRNTQVCTI